MPNYSGQLVQGRNQIPGMEFLNQTSSAAPPAKPLGAAQVAINPNQQFNTGIPNFDNLSQTASGNVGNLLAGTESPDITRNIMAQWGGGAGLAPGSEFARNRSADLYGERSAARKEQGLKDLLGMLQGYSGTVTARPSDILGQQNLNASNLNVYNMGSERNASSERENAANLTQRREQELLDFYFKNKGFNEDVRRYDLNQYYAHPSPPSGNTNYGSVPGDFGAISQAYWNSINNPLPGSAYQTVPVRAHQAQPPEPPKA